MNGISNCYIFSYILEYYRKSEVKTVESCEPPLVLFLQCYASTKKIAVPAELQRDLPGNRRQLSL